MFDRTWKETVGEGERKHILSLLYMSRRIDWQCQWPVFTFTKISRKNTSF